MAAHEVGQLLLRSFPMRRNKRWGAARASETWHVRSCAPQPSAAHGFPSPAPAVRAPAPTRPCRGRDIPDPAPPPLQPNPVPASSRTPFRPAAEQGTLPVAKIQNGSICSSRWSFPVATAALPHTSSGHLTAHDRRKISSDARIFLVDDRCHRDPHPSSDYCRPGGVTSCREFRHTSMQSSSHDNLGRV